MRNLTYMKIKYRCFRLHQLKWGTDFMFQKFQKNDFENSKNWQVF